MPIPPRSITSEMIGLGEIRPENLAVGIAAISLPSGAITDTTQWLTHTTKDFFVPTKRTLLYVDLCISFSHNAAAAKFGYGLWIYDMDTGSPLNGVTAWRVGANVAANGIAIPVAGEPYWLTSPARISFDTDHLNRNPGPKRVYFVVRSYTAGTLTTGDPAVNTNAALITLVGK